MDCAPAPKEKKNESDLIEPEDQAQTQDNAGSMFESGTSPSSTALPDEEAQFSDHEYGDEGQDWWARGGLFRVSNEALNREELRRFVEKFKKYVPKDEEENILAEKLTFIFSCLQVVFMGMLATSDALVPFTPYFHTLTYPFLFLVRYFQYRSRKHHYFVLDFCYWFNLLLILYFVAFPQSASLFAIIFALSHGPVACTILLYRNSLVFHSIDRFTSFYIHFAPMLCCYALRWNPINASRYWYATFNVEMTTDDVSFLKGTAENQQWLAISLFMIFGSIITYETWQAAYGFLLGVVGKYCSKYFHVYHDESRMTLYRYSKQAKKGWLYNLLMVCGEKGAVPVWVLLNMTFTLLCCLPAYLWYEVQGAGAAFVILVYIVAANNGAGFYLKAWAKIQMRRRERIQQRKTETALQAKV